MRASRLLTGVAILLGATAFAQAEPRDPGLELVDEFVGGIATFAGHFEQSLLDADGAILERTTGTLEIRRPGQFRWSYIEPYEQELVADGLNIWSYDVDLAQVTVKPQAEALSNTPALLLGGSGDALDQFNHAGTEVKDGVTWVRMQPRNTQSGFLSVDLGFVDRQLNRMVFRDNLEQTTVVLLSDVRVNEPIDAADFEFEVPDDADVVGSPAVADASLP